MKRFIVLCLVGLMTLSACSKLSSAKRAYRKGDYHKAQLLLEQYVEKFSSDPEAQKFLVLVQSGLASDSAATLVKSGDLENALPLVEQSIAMNGKNQDAQSLLATCVNGLLEKLNKELLPGKEWAKAVGLIAILEKYRPDDKTLPVQNAKCVFEKEKGVPNWRTILAIKQAITEVPDDPFLKQKNAEFDAKSKPFLETFNTLQKAFAKKDFKLWKSLAHPHYVKECEADVARLKERNDPTVTSVEKYFDVIAMDPEKYGSPEGAEIVCVEPLSPDHAFVHFTYKNLPKLFVMEITRMGGSLKIDRELDSDIPKPGL